MNHSSDPLQASNPVSQSTRIQTSFLNSSERKLLLWLAARQPQSMTSNKLTAIGVLGALIIAAGYILTWVDIRFLWLASFGFVVNWYGDSLDGTLSRYRNTQRPLFGFFLDHNVDGLNETVMFIGLGLSCLMHLPLAMLILVLYLLLSCYVYICAHLKGEFKLSYAKFGPTEFRLLAILANTLLLFIPALRLWSCSLWGVSLSLLDCAAIIVSIVLFIMLLVNLIRDGKALARQDPPKPWNP